MQTLIRPVFFLVLSFLAAACFAQTDAARDYPNKAVHIVIPFSAGGGNDIVARVLSAKLTNTLNQPVIVENRPGAQGFIAGQYVAKAAPDGYTVLMGPTGPMAISPAIYSKMPYSTLRDFAPVTMVGSFPLVLVVDPKLPIKSVAELVSYAKSHPTSINYASTAATFQLTSELFNLRTGTKFLHIPYKGSNEMVNAVLSGQVTIAFPDPPPLLGALKAGRVRGLAVTGAKRHPSFPDLPTMAEAGVADMIVPIWMGLFLPVAAPAAIVQRLRDEVAKALTSPDVREKVEALGVEPSGMQPAEFATFVKNDIERWTAVAKAANIKAD